MVQETWDFSQLNKYGESRHSHSLTTSRYSSSHTPNRSSHRWTHYRPKRQALVSFHQPSTPVGCATLSAIEERDAVDGFVNI